MTLKKALWILAPIVIGYGSIGCGAMDQPEAGYELDGKAENKYFSPYYEAGSLVAADWGMDAADMEINGQVSASYYREENFQEKLYSEHFWKIHKKAGAVISMELDTFGTFAPVVFISYLPVLFGGGSGCVICLNGTRWLKNMGGGRYIFTLVTDNSGFGFNLSITSEASYRSEGGLAPVAPSARYSLRMLPVGGGALPGQLTAQLDEAPPTDPIEAAEEMDMTLEFKDQALLRFTPDQEQVYVARAELITSSTTGSPVVPLVYQGQRVEAVNDTWYREEEHKSYFSWGVAFDLEQITWEIGEDKNYDLLWEDAEIKGVKVFGIATAALIEKETIDLRVCPRTGTGPVVYPAAL